MSGTTNNQDVTDKKGKSMPGSTNNQDVTDKKPDVDSYRILLKVKGQDGEEVFFMIKKSTQLKKLMNAYCDRQSMDFTSVVFSFGGRKIHPEQTPAELEMENEDKIDAVLHQTGGRLRQATKFFIYGCTLSLLLSGMVFFA